MSSLIYLSVNCMLATSNSWLAALWTLMLYVSPAVWSQRPCPSLTHLPYTSGQPWWTLVNSVPVNSGGLPLCLPMPSGIETDAVHMLGAPERKRKDVLLRRVLSHQLCVFDCFHNRLICQLFSWLIIWSVRGLSQYQNFELRYDINIKKNNSHHLLITWQKDKKYPEHRK